MMLKSQNQPQSYHQNYVYEIVSDSSLPDIESLKNGSTSVNHQQFKYWNPATIDDNSNSSHIMQSVDQMIGEL
jgi:predicted nicotinamide N-methyase